MLGGGLNSLIPDQYGSNQKPEPAASFSGNTDNNFSHSNPSPPSNTVTPSSPTGEIEPNSTPSFSPQESKTENNYNNPIPIQSAPAPVSPPISVNEAPESVSETKTTESTPDSTVSSEPLSPVNNETEPKPTEHVYQLEVEKILPNPYQPRREFNPEALHDLASSIREFGVLQPLVVTKVVTDTPTGQKVHYELIAGERRLRASKLAGLTRVPAVIRQETNNQTKLELAIIENLQREDLNPIESARAYSQLQDEYHLTQREIAARLGKSREGIANTMRLLSLPTYIQEAVVRGQIGESQARLLLSVTDLTDQENLFNDLLKNSLSVRELKNRITSGKARTNAVERFQNTDPEIRHLEEKLRELLGAKVKIDQSGDSGKITISFGSADELRGVLHRLNPTDEEMTDY